MKIDTWDGWSARGAVGGSCELWKGERHDENGPPLAGKSPVPGRSSMPSMSVCVMSILGVSQYPCHSTTSLLTTFAIDVASPSVQALLSWARRMMLRIFTPARPDRRGY